MNDYLQFMAASAPPEAVEAALEIDTWNLRYTCSRPYEAVATTRAYMCAPLSAVRRSVPDFVGKHILFAGRRE